MTYPDFIFIEYKEKDEDYWIQMKFPPGPWIEIVRLSKAWGVSVRVVDSLMGQSIKEYHPYYDLQT